MKILYEKKGFTLIEIVIALVMFPILSYFVFMIGKNYKNLADVRNMSVINTDMVSYFEVNEGLVSQKGINDGWIEYKSPKGVNKGEVIALSFISKRTTLDGLVVPFNPNLEISIGINNNSSLLSTVNIINWNDIKDDITVLTKLWKVSKFRSNNYSGKLFLQDYTNLFMTDCEKALFSFDDDTSKILQQNNSSTINLIASVPICNVKNSGMTTIQNFKSRFDDVVDNEKFNKIMAINRYYNFFVQAFDKDVRASELEESKNSIKSVGYYIASRSSDFVTYYDGNNPNGMNQSIDITLNPKPIVGTESNFILDNYKSKLSSNYGDGFELNNIAIKNNNDKMFKILVNKKSQDSKIKEQDLIKIVGLNTYDIMLGIDKKTNELSLYKFNKKFDVSGSTKKDFDSLYNEVLKKISSSDLNLYNDKIQQVAAIAITKTGLHYLVKKDEKLEYKIYLFDEFVSEVFGKNTDYYSKIDEIKNILNIEKISYNEENLKILDYIEGNNVNYENQLKYFYSKSLDDDNRKNFYMDFYKKMEPCIINMKLFEVNY